MKTETVWLQRPGEDVPWGFRLQGGVDKGSPLTVCRVSPGSIASTGVSVGDVILKVGEADTANLTHDQAQYYIKAAGNLLQLHIRKGGTTSPSVLSPQPDKVAAANFHNPTMTSSSSTTGVHDLFRDMYNHSPVQPCRTSPADNHPYTSRPPPVAAAPSSYSPSPFSSQQSSDRQIPIQVRHARPNVLYKAEYAEKDEDKPKPYVARVQEDGSVPSSHFTAVTEKKRRPFVVRSVSEGCPLPPPPPGGRVYAKKPPAKPQPEYEGLGRQRSGPVSSNVSQAPTPPRNRPFAPLSTPKVLPYRSPNSEIHPQHPSSPSAKPQIYPFNTMESQSKVQPISPLDNQTYLKGYNQSANLSNNKPSINPSTSYQHPSSPNAYTTYPPPSPLSPSSAVHASQPRSPRQGPLSPNFVTTPQEKALSSSPDTHKPAFLNRTPRPFLTSPIGKPQVWDRSESGGSGAGFPTPPPEADKPAEYAGASTPTSAPPTPSALPTPPPPPPPPPPLPPSQVNTPSSSKPVSNDSQYANRLSEQLANMEMHNTPTSPTPYGTQPDYSSPSGGYQDFNNEPSYDNYSNANYTNDNYNADSYNNQYNSYNDQPPAPMSPQINSAVPQAPPLPSQMPSYNRSQPTPPPAMPDAVLNMAAKGGPEKKPWAYAPDADMLKEHRDRVRRRGAGPLMPRYQNLLNMPSFEDPPAPVNSRPQSSQSFTGASDPQNLKAGADGSVVAHAQYNSPLGLYTEDNVLDAFTAQTDGQVTDVRTVSGAGRPSGGPDITQSAVYKMIHGLDEQPPTAAPPQRQASEGTSSSQLPQHACSQSQSDTSSNSLSFEDGSLSNSIPSSTRSPVGLNRAGQARQGLSFLILQCLYDDADQNVPVGTSSSDVITSGSGSLSPASSIPSTPGSLSSNPGNHGIAHDSFSDGSLSPNSTNTRKVQHWNRGFRSPRRQPSVDDETSFSGVNRGDTYDHIPSRAFQRLQSLTGGGEVDRSSIMPNVTGDDEGENDVGHYNEASIRYKGGSIPSKAFRMLKSMTGGDDDLPPVAAKPTRRNLRRAESAPGPHEDDQDGGVDLSYVGGHIPSKTFRMLQQSVGADPADYDTGVSNGMEEPMVVAPSDSQSHPGDPHAAARERRRRRRRGSLPRRMSPSPQRRPVLPREPPHEARRDEFDEASYLAGRIPIVRSEDEVKDNPVVRKTVDEAADEHEKHQETIRLKNRSDDRDFDEKKWLRGENPVWGGSTDAIKVMSGRPSRNKAAWEKEATPEREFDENAFLAGKVNIINDPDSETNLPPRAPRKKEFSAKPDWARTVDRKKRERAFERSTSQVADDRQREQEKAARQYIDVEEVPTKPRNFDERAYLSGNVAIFDDKPVAPRPMVIAEPARPKVYEFQKIAQRRASIDFVDPLAKAEYAARMMEAAEDDKPLDDNEPFDEHAFLEGQLPIVSGEAKPRAPREPKVFKEVPAWAKRVSQDHEQPADEGNFNERAFLHGQIPMVKGGTPDLRPVNRPRKKKPKKPVEEAPPEDQEPFDEKAFLAGRVPILGGATESALPPREPKKQVERHLAPWERKQREDDIYIPPTNEFDEKDFLQGKVPVITGDTERQLPMRQALPPRPIRRPVVEEMPKAPWEKFRPSAAEEDGENTSEFDERDYLAGRVSVVRKSVERDLGTSHAHDSNQNQRIPSKTFIRLSRSVSRDAPAEAGESDFEPKSPKPHLKVLRSSRPRKPKYDRSRSLSPGEAARRQKELQEGTTKDVPLNDMAYKGTNIPSKSFMRLQSHVDKPDEVKIDPLDRLRPKKASRPDESIDPEKALEQMSIQEHSPEKYFDALEQVVKDSDKSGPQVNGVDASEAKPTPAAPAPAPAPAPAAPKQAQPVKQVEPKSPSSGIKIINLSSPQPKSDDMPTFAEGEDQVTDF